MGGGGGDDAIETIRGGTLPTGREIAKPSASATTAESGTNTQDDLRDMSWDPPVVRRQPSMSSSTASSVGFSNNSSNLLLSGLNLQRRAMAVRKAPLTHSSSSSDASLVAPLESSASTSQQHHSQRHHSPPTTELQAAAAYPSGSEASDLVTSLTQRLTLVERMNSRQAALLADRERELVRLRETVRAAQDSAATEAREKKEQQRQAQRLSKQVCELEAFLADYGLVWVGYRARDSDNEDGDDHDEDDDEEEEEEEHEGNRKSKEDGGKNGNGSGGNFGSDGDATSRPKKEKNKDDEHGSNASNKEIEIYFDPLDFIRHLRELNQLAGDGKMQIVRQNNMHKFAAPSTLPVTIYRNGLFLRSGPLRPYAMRECQLFIQDVMEGYFPSELKDEFPLGVVFAPIEDKSSVYCPPPHGLTALSAAMSSSSSSSSAHSSSTTSTTTSDNTTVSGSVGAGSSSSSHTASSSSSATSASKAVGGSSSFKPFQSAGNRLTDDPSPASARAASTQPSNPAPPRATIASLDASAAQAPESADRFLARLPVTVVSDGHVVDVRAAVAKLLGQQPKLTTSSVISSGVTPTSSFSAAATSSSSLPPPLSNVILVETPTLSLIRAQHGGTLSSNTTDAHVTSATNTSNHSDVTPSSSSSSLSVSASSAVAIAGDASLIAARARPNTPRDIATVRVKMDKPPSQEGDSNAAAPVLLVKLRFTSTIGELRAAVSRQREALKYPPGIPYELRTAFPSAVLSDDKITLKDAKLTPNGNVVVRCLPPPSGHG